MRAFGKYRLVEPIASGGMAEVWRAEVPGAEGFVKEVALKLIRGDHDAHGEFVAMFIREARLASRLAHGNVVQVFDFDQVDGRYYIAMELVRGRTLRQVVDRCRELGVRFGVARAVHVCAEVARALAYAHRVEDGALPGGVVHRDVSPQNVLLSFEGEVKLTDFGIARALHSADVTSPGTVKGKLAYMAPEQARGLPVDARADVFSVGVILWELCTGRRLFARDSDAAMLAAVVASEPVSPPSAWNEAVPPELDAIVLGALARDATQRTASAEILAAALASLRLRLATSHEDLDLRVMLRRLWPDGVPSAAAAPGERTAIRLAPECDGTTPRRPVVVSEAVPQDVGPAPRATGPFAPTPSTPDPSPPAPEPVHEEDVPTRTAVPRPGAPPRRRRPVLWVGVVAALAAVVVARWTPSTRSAPDPVPAVAASAPERTPEATPTAAPSSAPPPAQVTAGPPRVAASSPFAVSGAKRSRRATALAAAAPAPGVTPAAPAPVPAPVEDGRIVVRAIPWAFVTIDGVEVGDTPVDRAATAAEHHLHAHHPTLGDDDRVVKLAPGERYVWRPRLAR